MPFKPGRDKGEPNYKGLISTLNRSFAKEKDTALFQVIKSLIDYGGQSKAATEDRIEKLKIEINNILTESSGDGAEETGPTPKGIVVREIPTGIIDGVNITFTLAYMPIADSEQVYLNGLLQDTRGIDYSISGSVITFLAPPLSGDRILVTYQRA